MQPPNPTYPGTQRRAYGYLVYQNSSSLSLTVDSSTVEVLNGDKSKGTAIRTFSLQPVRAVSAPDRLIMRGELDIDVHPRLRSVLTSLQPSSKALVLDLTRVTYIDCSSLRLLAEARLSLSSKMRPVVFRLNVDSIVWRMIRWLAVERFFPVGLDSCESEGAIPTLDCARNRPTLNFARGD
jgi:anti-anti-sigma factor